MKGVTVAVVGFFITCLAFGSAPAAEANYPSRSIEVNVGFAPGAGTDLGTRLITEKAKKYLNNQDFVCVNKPGGSGRAAVTLVAKAKPDGYTLAASTDAPIILTPHQTEVPYKPREDFTVITQFGVLNHGVVVKADSPFKTFNDVIAYAQANPDKLTVSHPGEGSSNEISFQTINRMKGISMKTVPFNGAAPAITALLGGHVMVASTASSGYAPHIRAKTLRLIAVLGDERVPEAPDVPTLRDLGFPMGFQSWYVITAPKGLDKGIQKKLADAFGEAMKTPEYIKLAKELEIFTPKPLMTDELWKALMTRDQRYAELFKKLGIGIAK